MGNVTNLRPFQPGVSGNPGGKPAGARNRLQADFLSAMAEHFAANGKTAIERVFKQNPLGYLRAIVALMPKQFEATDPFADMSADEIQRIVAIARAAKAKRESEGATE